MDMNTHRPEELLLKSEQSGSYFQPGHVVGHATDGNALGMVVSRTVEPQGVECVVLWSSPPRPNARPFRQRPTPVRAMWTPSLITSARPGPDYARRDKSDETFDGEETFDSCDMTMELASEMCREAISGEVTFKPGGYMVISRRGVYRHQLPKYIRGNPIHGPQFYGV